MKRFETLEQLRKALNNLNDYTLVKNSNDPKTWYYISVPYNEEGFYYLTEEEIKEYETKKTYQ